MKKNEIFTFTAPNGVEVTAVVVHIIKSTYVCYAQNRLFEMRESPEFGLAYNGIIIDYCILPDYDRMLEDYYHQLDLANDYASKEL